MTGSGRTAKHPREGVFCCWNSFAFSKFASSANSGAFLYASHRLPAGFAKMPVEAMLRPRGIFTFALAWQNLVCRLADEVLISGLCKIKYRRYYNKEITKTALVSGLSYPQVGCFTALRQAPYNETGFRSQKKSLYYYLIFLYSLKLRLVTLISILNTTMGMRKMFRSQSSRYVLALALGASLAVGASVWATSVGTNVAVTGTFSVSGASTLTGSINASSTALITGNVTTFGNATFGDAGTDINLFTGTLQASTTVLLSPPVVMYNNLTVGTSTAFFVNSASTLVGVGTSTPANAFSVQGDAYISGSLKNVQNITATGTVTIGANGTTLNSIITGFCDFGAIAGTGGAATIAATSTGAVACQAQAPAGLAAGDKVWLTASSTGQQTQTPGVSAYIYAGVASSTASNRIQAIIFNPTGQTLTIGTTSWQYLIIK